MKCYLSTSCFGNEPVAKAVEKCLKFDVGGVELSAPHPYETVDSLVQKLKKFKRMGCKFTLHNYFPPPEKEFVLNIASGNLKIAEANRKLFKDSLFTAVQLQVPYFGVHAGYLTDAVAQPDGMFLFEGKTQDYATALENAAIFIREETSKSNDAKVILLLENEFPTTQGKKSLFCSFDEIRDLLDRVPLTVGLLLDLGHLNISSHILGFDKWAFLESFLDGYGARLFEVHFSENDGRTDDHLPVRASSWQLEAAKLIQTIRPAEDRQRVFCLESRHSGQNEMSNSLELINEYINF